MKKSYLYSLASGVMLALSFPVAVSSGNIFEGLPNGILIFFALIPLFHAIDSEGGRNSFAKGLVAGLAFYLVSQFWIIIAMRVFGNLSWLASFSILMLMVVYLSMYTALFSLMVAKARKTYPLTLIAPLALVSVELLKNYVFEGYPWMNPAYALSGFRNIIQISDITGIYALTFLVALVNASLYETLRYALGKRKFPKTACITSLALLLLFSSYGIIRIRCVGKTPVIKKERVALVQGNIPQDEKWARGQSGKIIDKYITLSKQTRDFEPSLIVWPEAALPYSTNINQKGVGFLRRENFKSKFIVGSTSHGMKDGHVRSYNSAFYLSPDGRIIERYDKIHLVPFSEHVLYEDRLPFIRKIVPPVAGEFSAGREIKVFTLMDSKFGVLICFESIFGLLSRSLIRDGADFLVNITNDAWFGKTSGPYQHFEMAKFRAIEERVYFVRAANTGVSSVIDDTGAVVQKTDLFTQDVITATVEIKRIKTIYSQIGDSFAYACAIACVFLLISTIVKLRRRH